MRIGPIVLGMGAGLAACLAGCVSDIGAETAAVPMTHPAETVASATPMDAGKLTISAGHTFVYDTESGVRLTVSQEALPDCHCAGRSWWVRYSSTPGGEADREVKMVIDTNGYISEAEEINRLEKVEIEYAPPLVVIPDKLPVQAVGDAAFRQDVKMTVHPLGNRAKVRTSGMAHNEIRYVGDEHITTAAGEFSARKLQCTFTADLSAATTMNTSQQWWADGVGLIFEKDHELTRAMGLKVREHTTTLMLKSYTPGGPPANH
jgi:hypothetical protein